MNLDSIRSYVRANPLAAPVRVDRPLSTVEIAGNLQLTGSSVWAWYLLGPERWSFKSLADREATLARLTHRWSRLAGYQIRIRVSSHPFDANDWRDRYQQTTEHPLPPVDGAPSWGDHLDATAARLAGSLLDEKVVIVGVRLGPRPRKATLADLVDPAVTSKDVVALVSARREVDDVMAGQGFAAAPVSAPLMSWLLHRSIALGVTPPEQPAWLPDEIGVGDGVSFTDPVEWSARPFSPTVEVRAWHHCGEAVRYVAVLTMGRMDDQRFPENGRAPWMLFADRFPFPVEWSVSGTLLTGAEMTPVAEHYSRRSQEIARHYGQHRETPAPAVARAITRGAEIYDEVTEGDDETATRFVGVIRLAVTGTTPEKCLENCRAVIDAYGSAQRMQICHPRGQAELLREFIPGEPAARAGYQRVLPLAYLAAGMPNVSATVGTPSGPYIGYTCGASRRAVLHDWHWPMERLDASGLVTLTAGPGGGKSAFVGLAAYESALRGDDTIVLDPSGPLAALCRMPELAAHARLLDLSGVEAGTLNPYGLVPDPVIDGRTNADQLRDARRLAASERKQLVLDILRMLLPYGVQHKDGTDEALSTAVRTVGGSSRGNPWHVVDALRTAGHTNIAELLEDAAEMPTGRLIFPDSHDLVDVDLGSDATLVVITMPGVVLPDPDSDPRQWTEAERLAVPLLHLAVHFTSRFIYAKARDTRKLVCWDENHFFRQSGSGRALHQRIARDSRKVNAAVIAASQLPDDTLGQGTDGLATAAFVGRLEDETVARQALKLLGVPEGAGYERTIMGLSRTASGEKRPGEFLYRDIFGRVERIRIDLEAYPHLLAILDTTPTGQRHPTRTTSRTDDEAVA